jgi:hypothetical protein
MAGDQRLDAFADSMGVHIDDGHAIHFTQFGERSATTRLRSRLYSLHTEALE